MGIRKRPFDRSTVIIKQREDKIYIGTNYIVVQRSDKCKKHENVKKRGIKNNKNIQEQDKKKTIIKKLFKNFRTNLVTLYIETWSQFVNKKTYHG